MSHAPPVDTQAAKSSPTALEQTARFHFDYALSGILETDDRWQMQRCNQAGLNILRRSAKELQAQALDQFLQAGDSAIVQSHFRLLREQGVCHSVLRLPSPSGAIQWLELSSVQAEEQLYIHFFEDVTLQREQATALEAARAAAEEANQAKSALLANVSHELRTPLNGILGLTQLSLMGEMPVQTRQHLEKIARSGQTLLRMLNDLLDLARMESGKMAYEQASFDLWELLDELAATVSHLALGKPLEIAFLLAPGVPRWLMGDRLRLHQILTNLLGNAVKFTAKGEVALEISWIEDQGRPVLQMAVQDTGPGLDDATLTRLFQPFTQANSHTTRHFGGSGLGLAISRQLARGMGGELQASSTIGQGSCFMVRLPLQSSSDAPPTPKRQLGVVGISSDQPLTRRALHQMVRAVGAEPIDVSTSSQPAISARIVDLVTPAAAASIWTEHSPDQGPTLLLTDAKGAAQWRQRTQQWPMLRVVTRPLTPVSLLDALTPQPSVATTSQRGDLPREFRGARIAVAEDMPVNRDVIVGLLELAGIEVMLARDGKELLALFESATPAPELVLMDVHMPVMDGLAATRALRASGWTLPVVALSAGALDIEQARCMAAGMNDFLPKPIELEQLWGTLTRWLRPRWAMPSKPPAAASDASAGTDRLQAWQAAGVDVGDALPRFLGRMEALERALEQLLDQHATDPEKMAALLAQGQWKATLEVTHALKGCAATVGARRLMQRCQLLEARLKENPLLPVQNHLDELGSELQRLGQIRQQPDSSCRSHLRTPI